MNDLVLVSLSICLSLIDVVDILSFRMCLCVHTVEIARRCVSLCMYLCVCRCMSMSMHVSVMVRVGRVVVVVRASCSEHVSVDMNAQRMHLIGWQNTWEQAPGVPATPSPP